MDPTFVSPRYSMKGRPKDSHRDHTPGPLDYSPEKPRTSRASALHPKLKYFPDSAQSNPGPGAYQLGKERVSDKVTPPTFSIRGRLAYSPTSLQTPGPGAYQLEGNSKRGFTMTPRREDKDHRGMMPGPGAYTPQRPKTTAFSIRGRMDYNPASLTTPGPAAYDPKVDFYSVKKGIPSFSMVSRTKLQEGTGVKNGPGPGHYNPSIEFYSTKVSSPRMSMHGRLNPPNSGMNNPGPNQYNPQRPSSAPAPTLKGRVQMGSVFVTPHATAYDPKLPGKSPSFSIRGRVDYKPKSLETPGPGHYNAAFTFFETK